MSCIRERRVLSRTSFADDGLGRLGWARPDLSAHAQRVCYPPDLVDEGLQRLLIRLAKLVQQRQVIGRDPLLSESFA
jgi:hypothetical protein